MILRTTNVAFPNTNALERRLGELALDFRGTRCESERQRIVEEYSQAVAALIKSGIWEQVPSPDEQLPDDWMPPEFFEYWARLADISSRAS